MGITGDRQLVQKLDRLQRDLLVRVPRLVQADAVRHFKMSFRNQGFTDAVLQRWRPTKRGKPGRILKRTGLLMRSVRPGPINGTRIQVLAGGPYVPYARIHNEGGTIQRQVTIRQHERRAHYARTRRGRVLRKAATVRRHQARMNVHLPKRQFIGASQVLERTMRMTILRTIRTYFPA